jgi:hypothetical protein
MATGVERRLDRRRRAAVARAAREDQIADQLAAEQADHDPSRP